MTPSSVPVRLADGLGAVSLHSSDLVYRNGSALLLIGDNRIRLALGKSLCTFLDAHCNLESLYL
jgi:hypothetical protein